MNVLIPILVALALFVVIGRWYSRHLAKVLGENPNAPVPAVTKEDGVDYVPTRTPIAFAQHFAAIAGAGPIVGPIMALVYGWQWCWLWVVFGALFFGAAHDYLALMMSVREEGATIVGLARKYMGKTGYVIFIAFVVTMLLIVNAVFLIYSASALTSLVPVSDMHFSAMFPATWFNVIGEGESAKAQIGGIGSTSVIVITAFAPLLGWMYIKKKISTWICSILALILCTLSIVVGFLMPVELGYTSWLGVSGLNWWVALLALYCLVAAGLPLWMLIQARDFINVHILYIGLGIMVLGLTSIGLQGGRLKMATDPAGALQTESAAAQGNPASRYQQPAASTATAGGAESARVSEPTFDLSAVPLLWPGLFVTIACGAVSGFHSLCASGTASRQVNSEPAARQVGVYAMLLEGLLAVMVIVAVGYTFSTIDYARVIYPGAVLKTKSNAVIIFSQAIGTVGYDGLGIPMALGTVLGMLMLEGFLVTTLDTSVRITRYLLEELLGMIWVGKKFNPWLTTALVVIGSLLVTFTGSAVKLWTVFGTGNQLLAAFGLIVASLWLLKTGRNAVYALVPACIMLTTTLTMLVMALVTYVKSRDILLIITCALVLFLGVAFLLSAIKALIERLKAPTAPTPA